MSTTKNLFPYPGNKARHAEWIIQHMPEHTCYVEPFGGAAGVLFNKPKSEVEVYNDLDGDIVHFFEVLRDQQDELHDWLDCVPFSRQLHEKWASEFYDGERPGDDVERAGRFFYLRFTQWGGKYNANKGFRATHHRSPPDQYRRRVESLHEFSERLKNVTIECMSWDGVIEYYDAPHTVFYIDPPYGGDEAMYLTKEFEHSDLHKKLCDIEGWCLVSYGALPDCYGDEFHIRMRDSSFKINSDNGEKEVTEYLIMDFDPEEVPRFSGAGQSTLSELV